MSKEYIDGVAIDPEIYSNWPAALEESWIGFFAGSPDTPACFIVAVDGVTTKQIVELPLLPEVYCPAKMNVWMPKDNENVMLVYGIWVQPEWRRKGVASFLLVAARTWLAQTKGVKLMAQPTNLNADSSATLQGVQELYSLTNEEVFYTSAVEGPQ